MARHRWSREREIAAEMLRNMRLAASLNQAEVAAALGTPQSHVSKYESGERGLEMHQIRAVCEACNASLVAFAQEFDERLAETGRR